MVRSTKIVATLGPSSSDAAVLERMIRAGVDVVRLNFSHGTADDHLRRAELVKEIARKVGRTVAILCDHATEVAHFDELCQRRVIVRQGIESKVQFQEPDQCLCGIRFHVDGRVQRKAFGVPRAPGGCSRAGVVDQNPAHDL